MTASRGPFVSRSEAAKMAGISTYTLYIYIKNGYLETYLDGTMVYYRDVLRASWIAYQRLLATSGKNSANYKKSKKTEE